MSGGKYAEAETRHRDVVAVEFVAPWIGLLIVAVVWGGVFAAIALVIRRLRATPTASKADEELAE